MKKFMLHGFLAMLAASMIVGCGGGSDDDPIVTDPPAVTPPAASTSTVDLGNVSYSVPNDVKADKISGVDGAILTSGSKQEVAGFVQVLGSATPKVAGLLASAQRMQNGVADAYSQLQADTNIDSISLLSSQSLQTPYAFTIAQYKLVTVQGMRPLEVANGIVTTLSGGTATGLPLADPNAPIDTVFRFILLYGDYQGTTFYIAVVIPENQFAQYSAVGSSITNAASVAPSGQTLQNITDSFTTSTGSQNADFLFVVDDSGSMGDDQDALAKAAKDFTAEMSGSGVAYRSAIITTGYGADDNVSGAAYSILRNVGIIENNDSMLEQELVAGTSGSATETGIWNAEQALQSVASGDSANGAVTALGMPKSGASLSVIIISDEPSQYSYRAGVDFNVSDNLFLDRNIAVYSIIKPGYNYATTGIFDEYNSSQYDDLSMATGGIFASIENTVIDSNGTAQLDFSVIMKQIAQDAGGAASQFILAHPAAVINEVKVNGTVVPADAANGYTYVQASTTIVFHGTSLPPSGATIEVKYEYYQ